MVDPASGRVSRAPPYSGYCCLAFTISDTGLSPTLAGFPKPFSFHECKDAAVLLPRPCGRFGLLRFRSPLLPESLLISFPGVLRWFSSPGSASATYLFNCGYPTAKILNLSLSPLSILVVGWVTPFGNRRISGCVLLPVAFRSLPRPSSPRYAKASAVNPLFA